MPPTSDPVDPALYRAFWIPLLEQLRLRTSLFRNVLPASGPELTASQGPARWSCVLSDDSAVVALQVSEDVGAPVIADRLIAHRAEIELACGTRLVWRRTEESGRALCVIAWRVEEYGFAERGDWQHLRNGLAEALLRLHGACRPYLTGATERPGTSASPVDASALAARFTDDMVDTYYVLGEETGYWAQRFLQSVRRNGGVEAARRLLSKPQPSEGLETLRKIRRLDISVEADVLRPEYAALFTESEREVARERLRAFGYPV
jgi:hypothetical protein